MRYMATWRGTVKSFVRRFEARAAVVTPHCLATASWILSGVTREAASVALGAKDPWRAELGQREGDFLVLQGGKGQELDDGPFQLPNGGGAGNGDKIDDLRIQGKVSSAAFFRRMATRVS